MVVQHNMQAINTNRMLGQNVKAVAKSTEKLSSGYRVNRAADDAAGLSISEKMRNQIRGINQAVSNSEDGVSLIQTAEGNMNEIHSILQRMGELAVKARNDVNATEDRQTIQDEITTPEGMSAEVSFSGDSFDVTYKFDDPIDDADEKVLVNAFGKNAEVLKSGFEKALADLETQTGITGITGTVHVFNASGEETWSHEFPEK